MYRVGRFKRIILRWFVRYVFIANLKRFGAATVFSNVRVTSMRMRFSTATAGWYGQRSPICRCVCFLQASHPRRTCCRKCSWPTCRPTNATKRIFRRIDRHWKWAYWPTAWSARVRRTTARTPVRYVRRSFVAGPIHVVIAFQGFGGGPLQIMTEPDVFVQVGITSFGFSKCGDKHKPGVYTRVSKYAEWIEQTVWPDAHRNQ